MLIYLQRLSAKHFLFPFPLRPQNHIEPSERVCWAASECNIACFCKYGAHVCCKWREVKCYCICFWFHYKSLFSIWSILVVAVIVSELFARLPLPLPLTCIAPHIWMQPPYLLFTLLLSVFESQSHSVHLFVCLGFFFSLCRFFSILFFQSSFIRLDNV